MKSTPTPPYQQLAALFNSAAAPKGKKSEIRKILKNPNLREFKFSLSTSEVEHPLTLRTAADQIHSAIKIYSGASARRPLKEVEEYLKKLFQSSTRESFKKDLELLSDFVSKSPASMKGADSVETTSAAPTTGSTTKPGLGDAIASEKSPLVGASPAPFPSPSLQSAKTADLSISGDLPLKDKARAHKEEMRAKKDELAKITAETHAQQEKLLLDMYQELTSLTKKISEAPLSDEQIELLKYCGEITNPHLGDIDAKTEKNIRNIIKVYANFERKSKLLEAASDLLSDAELFEATEAINDARRLLSGAISALRSENPPMVIGGAHRFGVIIFCSLIIDAAMKALEESPPTPAITAQLAYCHELKVILEKKSVNFNFLYEKMAPVWRPGGMGSTE